MPVLRVDAQFTVVEAALKGYMKWRATHGTKPQEDVERPTPARLLSHADCAQEEERTNMENNLEGWCERLLAVNFEASFHFSTIIEHGNN